MSRVTALQEGFLRLLCHPVAMVAISAAGVLFAANAENEWLSVPFALVVVAVTAAILFLFCRRLAFSVYGAWMIVTLCTVISAIKYKMKGFSLHFYDAVFVARDPEVYRFLVGSYLYLIVPVAIALAAMVVVAVLLYRADRQRELPLAARAVLLAALVAALPLTYPSEASEGRYSYYMQGRHMSAFFVSLLDLRNLFAQHRLEQRLQAMAPQSPFPDTVDCGDTSTLPDLFVVLQETQTDPGYFPQIADGAGFLRRYAPGTAPPHPISVETFGGGTWITNLAMMSGLSANDFGWRSPYLTIALENRVRGALPEVLSRCGYRTVAMLPMGYTFVNEGPFLSSIGFETVLDIDDIKAPSYHMRDDFYYRAAEAFIARHREEDGRPLFLEIETMFPHSPYETRLEPSVRAGGEPFAKDVGVDEYLRRMAIARGDFQAFLDRRASEARDRPSVVFEFGDHQSFVTRPYVDEIAGEGSIGVSGSLGYRTFYSVTPFNHAMARPLPALAELDVGFVGASVLEAAGLPMSPMMRDLVRLRDACGGRFHACPDRAAVDAHLRRRVDSGMLHLFPGAAPLRPLPASGGA